MEYLQEYLEPRRVSLDAQGNIILPEPQKNCGNASLSDDEAYGERRCAHCSSPGCNLWCSGCDITDVGKIRTFYCTKECQTQHRPTHKVTCALRLKIGRATSILYELYMAFEKATCNKKIDKVVVKDGVVTMRTCGSDTRPYSGGSLFMSFPEEALLADVPVELHESILLAQPSGEVFITTFLLYDSLLLRKALSALSKGIFLT
ncbi:hypothetical protein CC79DRAFT_1318671 [Sarocladium strictum]